MSDASVAAARNSLTSVFNTLKQSMGGNSGTVNIFLVDFDTQINKSVSIQSERPECAETAHGCVELDGVRWWHQLRGRVQDNG